MVEYSQSNGHDPYHARPSSGSGYPVHIVSYRYSSYSSEIAPLLPGNRQPGGISMLGCFLAFLVISSVVYYTSMYFTGHPLYTSPGQHEEERQKHHLFWGHVEAHMCTTYATREYTAQLMNLPVSWKQRADACMATPLEVHGISHLPKICEDKGPGVVIGRWEISQHEPDCTTFWDQYSDKGCASPGSRKRHIMHKLENLPWGSDWREFCATTPVRFNNMEFLGAQECIISIWGVYGQWEVDDWRC